MSAIWDRFCCRTSPLSEVRPRSRPRSRLRHPPRCYLLHGAGDNVIPAAETVALARNLAERGADVHALVTPLITHAEVDRAARASDAWALVGFWSDVLSR